MGSGLLRRIHELAARLAAAPDDRAIADLVVGEVHDLLGAAASVAYIAADDDDGATLRAIASRGLPAPVAARLGRDAPLPLAAAVRTGAPLWLESRAELLAAYPDLAASTVPAELLQAVVAVPMIAEPPARGGFAFSFTSERRFDPELRELVVAIAAQCAIALDRVRTAERERRARERLVVLADASERLASTSLDLADVLDAACALIARRLPSTSAINLLGADGETLEFASMHDLDPEAQASARAILRGRPPRVGDPTLLGRAAASRRPILVATVPPELLRGSSQPEYREHLARFPFASIMVAPILRGDRLLGTITSSRGPAYPPFTDDDLRLLGELADRAGAAILHATLYQEARAAVRVRDDFLSVAGHELRTPLAAVLLQLESLERQLRSDAADLPRIAARVGKATASAVRLGDLIQELLDVSRITSGRLRLDPEPLDLAQLVGDVVGKLADAAALAGCELQVDLAAPVPGQWDRMRMEQVVGNLLANAIKYGAGAPIDVSLAASGDAAVLRVTDRGIGIEPRDLERIFGRFERAVSARHYGGFGLGLWIAREIVEAAGGAIAVASTPGQGATFTVTLPVRG